MCDAFCLQRRDGMLFAKSSDRPVDEVQILEWLDRRGPAPSLSTTYLSVPDAGASALLGSRPTWMWGLEHGVNEHRLAIGNEKVWTVHDPHESPPALLGMDLVRLGLERAATAEAAVDVITELLGEYGQGGSGEDGRDEPYWSSFLIADPHGGWVLETSGTTWVAQPVGAGAAISNRLTLSTGWSRSSPDVEADADWDRWRSPAAPTGIADHRLRATRRCVARGAGAVGPRQAVAALRDHGTGPWGEPGTPTGAPPPPPADVGEDWSGVTVCMHVRDVSCTTASMVADLPADPDEPMRVWASLGTPCTGVFLPVGVVAEGAVLAPVLGEADAWRAFSDLGRAVERPGEEGRGRLESVRSVLEPVEAAAWAEADELWSSRAGGDGWRQATLRWDERVRAVLAGVAKA
jgi:secernin